MWSNIGTQFVSGLGISTGAILTAESLLLINQHLFYPALKQIDIQTTKLLFGQEESLKTEYEYKIIEDKILNPIFNVTSGVINMAKGDNFEKKVEDKSDDISNNSNMTHNLQYGKDGAVRDVDKIGYTGSHSKFVSDAGFDKQEYDKQIKTMGQSPNIMLQTLLTEKENKLLE